MSATVADDSRLPAANPARRLFPGPWVRGLTGFALVCLLLCRTLLPAERLPFPLNDQGFVNIYGMIAAAVFVTTLWVWFSYFSGYSLTARRVVFFGGLLLAAGFFGAFRLKEVSGTIQLSFEPRWRPVADRRLGKIAPAKKSAAIDLTAEDPRAFPQFLGPDRSNWVPDPGLAQDWTAQPPKLIWRRPIGAGWPSFAATNGYAVTMEQRGDEEWVTCYRIQDGQPLWGQAVEARHENALGGIGPRATPTIDTRSGRIYTVGATGVVQAFDSDGKVLWNLDLLEHYGLTQLEAEVEVQWGRAGSPLIVDDLVILPAGGLTNESEGVTPKSLIALDAKTGKVAWEAGEDQISYASPALLTLAGVRQIVIVNEKTVSGHDPATGKELWQHDWFGDSSTNASSSQTVPVGNDRLLLTKGYGGGAELLQFQPAADGELQVETIWKNTRVLQTKFTNVVVRDGYIYGLSDGILECVDLETGERQWKQGRYGHGQVLGVGELLLVQAEDGRIVLVEASPDELIELTEFQALEGKTWNNPCLYGKTVLVRNGEEAACYELP